VSSELPHPLRAALDRELEGVSRKALAARAGRTSQAYRAGQGSAGVIQGREDALAYALARLPATYAACAAVLREARAMAPAFAPGSLLDAGSGPGAASWAAAEAYDLAAVTWLDASAPFLDLAARLASHGPDPLRAAQVLRADLTATADWPRADLVMASYALAEIAPALQGAVVARLWAGCDGVLALVEPGTPAGFERLIVAREALIGAGAEILAPCPHANACPLAAPDRPNEGFPGWCHFSIRLPRSRDHRLAKGAELPFEDEKFAYLIAARPGGAGPERAGRILGPPRAGKAGLAFRVCGPQGLEARAVPRRDKAAHAAARRLGWGDRLV
jgi:ribosomal protein RSM22 (predicted rRNA methylase)